MSQGLSQVEILSQGAKSGRWQGQYIRSRQKGGEVCSHLGVLKVEMPQSMPHSRCQTRTVAATIRAYRHTCRQKGGEVCSHLGVSKVEMPQGASSEGSGVD